MKILVLDDERWRHDLYDRALQGHEVHHVYTCAQFRSKIAALKDWDLVSFDHDLYSEGNGAEAALLYVADEKQKPAMCVVHSWNSNGGATRICDILIAAGKKVIRCQFGWTLLEQVLPAAGFTIIRDSRASASLEVK